LDHPESGIIGQALKRTSAAVGFWFLNFFFNIWKDFTVLSRFIQKWLYSSFLLGTRVVCTQTEIFSTKPAPKIRESPQFFGLRLVRRIFEETLTSRNPNQISATLWQNFSSNKSTPANRKKGFFTNRDPNKQEVGFIFVWSGSEL
jgi:hypothetical protein